MEKGVVYKIASRASEIGTTRFRMPRNVYSWLYGFAHLSSYSRWKINIEFPEDAEEVERQLRELCAFFLACQRTPSSIQRYIEVLLIRENRYDLLPDITGEPESNVYKMNIKTLAQTDAHDGVDGWDDYESVTELVKYFLDKGIENGFSFFGKWANSKAVPNMDDPRIENNIDRSWKDYDFNKMIKNEDFDPPKPGTDDFKVVTANRKVAFYKKDIDRVINDDDGFADEYYDALFDHEFMCNRLKAVSHLVGLSDSQEVMNIIKGRFDTTYKIYEKLLSSKRVLDYDKCSVRYEFNSFIRGEHLAENAVKQKSGDLSLKDIRQEISDGLRLEMDVKIDKLRVYIEKEYLDKSYREEFPRIVRSEVEKLLPDLFKKEEEPKSKPYKVYRSASYSYPYDQLVGSYDTIEEAKRVAHELNEEMEKMREEGALDLRDYRTAYVKEPGEKR